MTYRLRIVSNVRQTLEVIGAAPGGTGATQPPAGPGGGLQVDVNGDGNADFSPTLKAVAKLTTGDFLL